jgi:hypothetical protein
MSFGVATAGALLTSFNAKVTSQGGSSIQSFHLTFICMGAITCISTLIFAQLSRDHRKVVEVTAQVPE